tara:strand:+ start:600 stop:1133 length:534 start_codon:yes stop_codon:yes gene_type:complete
MKIKTLLFIMSLMILIPSISFAVDSNTVSSTVVTDKAPPTASAPSIVINNSDVCRSAFSAAGQTGFLGFATGIAVEDKNCERIKLARGLYGMGMKVAAVSMLCQDHRVFDAMMMAGTPCPYKGKIGQDAQKAWEENPKDIPSKARTVIVKVINKEEENLNNYSTNNCPNSRCGGGDR